MSSNFIFDIRAYREGTRGLSWTIKGKYVELLAVIYENGGPITMEEAIISIQNGKDRELALRTIETLIEMDKFYLTTDGLLMNGRCNQELQKQNWNQFQKLDPVPTSKDHTLYLLNSTIIEAYGYYITSVSKTGLPVPRGQEPNSRRAKLIKARLREHGLDVWKEACDKIAKSDFLCGRAGRESWTGATIDWFANATNFQKVLEGNYDRSNNSTPKAATGTVGVIQKLLDEAENLHGAGGEPRPVHPHGAGGRFDPAGARRKRASLALVPPRETDRHSS